MAFVGAPPLPRAARGGAARRACPRRGRPRAAAAPGAQPGAAQPEQPERPEQPAAARDGAGGGGGGSGGGSGGGGEVPLELVEGFLENARIRPSLDLDADEYMMMWKLRRMLHDDDFKKIFDQTDRRIGEH